MSAPVYFLWESGKDRFYVTAEPKPVPVLGYVSRKADGTWQVEHRGKIATEAYISAGDAAKALIDLVFKEGKGKMVRYPKPRL